MAFDGSGVFIRLRNWVADAAAGIKIRADYHDAEDDGFAAGLSNCITRDGQSVVTQNIPFNGKRITGLGTPVNDSDAATKASAYASSGDKVFRNGDIMTGDLVIRKIFPMIALDKEINTPAALVGRDITGKLRWALFMADEATETGSNEGSDFGLARYADAGTILDYILRGSRATGLLTVKADPVADLGIATKQYVDNHAFHPLTPQLFAGIPLVTPSFPYTAIATDAQKGIVGAGATTLPTNAAVPYPLGTAISFFAVGGNQTIAAGAGETLRWHDGFAVRTGTRTVADAGMATAVRLSTSVWSISGSGMT